MHLFAAKPGGFVDDEGIVDLAQTPGDIVILSAADSSLSALAQATERQDSTFPDVRLANWMNLVKPAAFDLYEHKILDRAKVVIVSLLGGSGYWKYGHERLLEWARQGSGRQLIMVPGCDAPDDPLLEASTVDMTSAWRVWRFLREGGVDNADQLLRFVADQWLDRPMPWREPKPIPNALLYQPDYQGSGHTLSLTEWRARQAPASPVCLLLFYRSHLQGANTQVLDGIIDAMESQGLSVLPVALSSLKEDECLSYVNYLIEQTCAILILNTTGFSVNRGATDIDALANDDDSGLFFGRPTVLQLILSSSTEDDWERESGGLRSRDVAMQVVLPEMDGRVITRAVGFKAEGYYSERCQLSVIRHEVHPERAGFVAQLARRLCRLRITPNREKRLALVLANYPNQDGRIGNGVGLDTPASTVQLLNALQGAGYPIEDIPENGDDLIRELQGSVTNQPQSIAQRPCWQSLALEDYLQWFETLPEASRQAVNDRWGSPEQDPKYRQGRLMIAGIRLGETFVGIQPERDFQADLTQSYHDTELVPPHSYLAFYVWLRLHYQVDAVIHVGKHGSLEWLPGKSTALSADCWPDIALGPLPHFYPFIVNDPGEGAQAKRRAHAIIIDHLMPPLSRAEIYGAMAELESLTDEYYQALGLDPRREEFLRKTILGHLRETGIDRELSHISDTTNVDDDTLLTELDTFLCDIKEAQIRHGLHILGKLPPAEKLPGTLVAILRLPRGSQPEYQGILHNLAADLGLMAADSEFDPLAAGAELWTGPRPETLVSQSDSSWRTGADTRERLEMLAHQVVADYVVGEGDLEALTQDYPATAAQCRYARDVVFAAMRRGVGMEIQSLIDGLSGYFVPPGPSGAPSRGRLDTLPTGRNFYTVDNRSVPSPAAWTLGEKSAQALVERYLQDHGDFPRRLGVSIWGTATMRTGGDDIAQAFALMGVKPVWSKGSQRVIDIEVIPTMLLQRPRVDVTLRVSGFFRDAFANVIRLFDAAVQAVANYEEPGSDNTVRRNVLARQSQLIAEGSSEEEAFRQSSYRVFGSKPGAYGTGLNSLIDGRSWEDRGDLAEAYLAAGGYAYGQASAYGVEARDDFEHQLNGMEAVVQNQDNREHDILDSNTYYQFQGGMANASRSLSGSSPAIYHADHANPALPKIRTLKEELNRVMRSRVLNPKWIGAMQEHGYKGAFEMAATVDYLFAYDATTDLVDDYQYEQLSDALVFDSENQKFLRDHNRAALEEMSERLLEATQRGLWREPGEYAAALQDLLLEMDEESESGSGSSPQSARVTEAGAAGHGR